MQCPGARQLRHMVTSLLVRQAVMGLHAVGVSVLSQSAGKKLVHRHTAGAHQVNLLSKRPYQLQAVSSFL